MALSKSRLQRLVGEYGRVLVAQQAAEAQALVQPPAKDKGEVAWRQIPEPSSETMSVSHDGVMIQVRGEGWKEVKMVSVAGVEQVVNPESGEVAVKLGTQSYRAGLWRPVGTRATFANQQWAETEQRGVSKAKRLACVADGATWIWQLVLMYFSPCFEILDWRHASPLRKTQPHGSMNNRNSGRRVNSSPFFTTCGFFFPEPHPCLRPSATRFSTFFISANACAMPTSAASVCPLAAALSNPPAKS